MDAKTGAVLQKETANKKRIAELEKELTNHQTLASDAGKEIAELSGIFEDRVKIIETVQSEKVQTIEKIGDVKSAMSALQEKHSNAEQRVGEVSTQIAELEQQK